MQAFLSLPLFSTFFLISIPMPANITDYQYFFFPFVLTFRILLLFISFCGWNFVYADMQTAFPPKSVHLKKPYAIQPWTDSDHNIGSLLMVSLDVDSCLFHQIS